eukprot:2978144-Pyramimonas_sp.AAC.1
MKARGNLSDIISLGIGPGGSMRSIASAYCSASSPCLSSDLTRPLRPPGCGSRPEPGELPGRQEADGCFRQTHPD